MADSNALRGGEFRLRDDAAAAQSFFSAVATGMIALTGIV